jgi:hypothetical protein
MMKKRKLCVLHFLGRLIVIAGIVCSGGCENDYDTPLPEPEVNLTIE